MPKGQAAVDNSTYSGGEATPPKAAPELQLRNSLGEAVDLAQYKGKAVLVTFIYTHCPDICPLIVSHLKTAQAELGDKAKDLQIIAVSTDPKGRHAEDRQGLPLRTRDDRPDAVPDRQPQPNSATSGPTGTSSPSPTRPAATWSSTRR